MPSTQEYTNLTAGLLIAAGGSIGYLKAGSKPSLIAGLAFGGALAGTVPFLGSNKKQATVVALG